MTKYFNDGSYYFMHMAKSIHYLRICSYWTHLGMQEYTENLLVSASHAASNSHWDKQYSKYYIFIHTVIKLCLQIYFLPDSHHLFIFCYLLL